MTKEVNRSGLYYVVPASIMDAECLEPLAKLLYALLSGLADGEGNCFPSDDYLSKRLRVSVRQAQDLVKQLEKFALISRNTVPCSHNPFKKIRTINVKTEFKKVIQTNARACSIPHTETPLDTARLCGLDTNTRAGIESEAIIESEEISCPPSEGVTTPDSLLIAEELWQRVKKANPKAKAPDFKKWAHTVDLTLRIDCRAKEDLMEAIRYSFEDDPFWAKTLQSPEGLRKHFDKIWVKTQKVDTRGGRRDQNLEVARQIKNCLAETNESHLLMICKDYVQFQSGDSVGYDLEPSTFEQILLKRFNIDKE